ncbi:MAG: hypothetical protein J3Q66DRAFT_368016 [Benniella sp.]|nr:MAG: hypothetical protein J3Q66DRAFT_368016 [Benniella sp.]
MANSWPVILTKKPGLLRGLRLSIFIFSLVMLALDFSHMLQLKSSSHSKEGVPWPFSELQGSSAKDGPGPAENDLHGYYLQLFIGDLMAFGMMYWVRKHPRVSDPGYHKFLRALFTSLLVILLLWYPSTEIVRTIAYTSRVFGGGDSSGSSGKGGSSKKMLEPLESLTIAAGSGGGGGGSKKNQTPPPTVASIYFCKNPNESPHVNCGIYRTRSIFAFILSAILLAELGVGYWKNDEEEDA